MRGSADDEPITQRIGALEEGARARVEGVVRAAAAPLRSPLLDRACVYWEVRAGLGDAPERREASVFWLEDGTGRLLVRGDAIDVDVRAQRAQEILTTVASDHQALSEALRVIKEDLKRAGGAEAKRLQARRAQLAGVVTFLLAVRAHARGKVHLGGSTLAQQARWIEANAPKERPAEGAATIRMAVDRYEVVLADGDRVVAEGVVATEPVPVGLVPGGGYREQPTARVLGPGSSGLVRVLGVGASRPEPPEPVRAGAPPASRGARSGKRQGRAGGAAAAREPDPRRFERGVLATLVLVALAAVAAWLFARA
ncbi:MAG: hypothetical protein KF729_19670 [Sandaracinaceae bacterium]|nr:hypothetical protein [Sandaracinaceae bacterium]